MKKILAMLLVCVMMVSCLAACSGSDTSSVSSETSEENSASVSSESEKDETETTSDEVSGEVTASFKEEMDGYEAFIKEYCDFIKSYTESDDMMGMLTEYGEYMGEFTDVSDAIANIDEESLSEADRLYFEEVTARIDAMLADLPSEE